MKIKVCGMRTPENIRELLKLPIDMIGFIFYEKSPRFVEEIPDLPAGDNFQHYRRVGVFVNAEMDYLLNKVN